MMQPPSPVLSVGKLTALIKETLEAGFHGLLVEGEISNLRPASSGHIYFSLKDHDAVISCALFRNAASRLNFSLKDGQQVRVRGDLSVYAMRGNYQIIVTGVSLAGEGEILLLLEERKRLFAAEGLFDQERKKPLPVNPQRIAVVTSPSGAAIRDFLQVLHRRHAGISVTILPTAVQGNEAPARIAAQIRAADIHKLGEVIIITRGGGSLEDLLAFSDELVVRAVAEAETPVISAVGHEIDWALSDFAADLRAPTPSAAAEIVSSSQEELVGRIRTAVKYLSAGVRLRVDRTRSVLENFSARRMERILRGKLQPRLLRLDDGKEELVHALTLKTHNYTHRIALATEKLKAGNPRLIMRKGYALIRCNDRVLRNSEEVSAGDALQVRLYQGGLDARVESIHKESTE